MYCKAVKRRGQEKKSEMKAYYLFITAVCATLFTLVPSQAEAIELVLKNSVTIHSNVVYVRDIVCHEALTGDEIIAQVNTILETELCRAPQPGNSRQLSRSYIAMKLKNNNVNIHNLHLDGAKEVNVDRGYSVLTKEKVAGVVAKYLDEHYSISPNETTLYFENFHDDVLLPSGTVDIDIEEIPSKYRNSKYYFRLGMYSNSTLYKKKVISVKVFKKGVFVVATSPIPARELIRAECIVLREMCLADSNAYFTSLDDVVGKMTRVTIKAGVPLERRYVEEKPLIRKGDMVSASCKQKNMNIVLKVRALEEGKKGDVIAVYSQATKKHFSGEVLSPDKVGVVF